MKNRILLNSRTAIIIFIIIGIVLSTAFNWNWILDLTYIMGGLITGSIMFKILTK